MCVCVCILSVYFLFRPKDSQCCPAAPEESSFTAFLALFLFSPFSSCMCICVYVCVFVCISVCVFVCFPRTLYTALHFTAPEMRIAL